MKWSPHSKAQSPAAYAKNPSLLEGSLLFRMMELSHSMQSGETEPRELFLFRTYWFSLPSGDFQDDMTDSLRDYTNLPEAAPLLTILDMSARAKYVMDVEEITPAIVEAFVNDFLAEKLKPEPI